MSESRNQISELVAAVEAVGEFGKIARRIFLTPGVVGAVHARLTLPSTVFTHPRPGASQLPGPPPVTQRAGSQPDFLHSPEAGQSVRVDHRLPPQMPVGPGRNLLTLRNPFTQLIRNATGAFFGDLHGRHERRLALRRPRLPPRVSPPR